MYETEDAGNSSGLYRFVPEQSGDLAAGESPDCHNQGRCRLEERLRYLRELEERRTAILSSVAEQGKLTDELKAQLDAADTKTRLEDLYLP